MFQYLPFHTRTKNAADTNVKTAAARAIASRDFKKGVMEYINSASAGLVKKGILSLQGRKYSLD